MKTVLPALPGYLFLRVYSDILGPEDVDAILDNDTPQWSVDFQPVLGFVVDPEKGSELPEVITPVGDSFCTEEDGCFLGGLLLPLDDERPPRLIVSPRADRIAVISKGGQYPTVNEFADQELRFRRALKRRELKSLLG